MLLLLVLHLLMVPLLLPLRLLGQVVRMSGLAVVGQRLQLSAHLLTAASCCFARQRHLLQMQLAAEVGAAVVMVEAWRLGVQEIL